MSDTEVTEDRIREERLHGVDVRAHWLYLATVLLGSIVLMMGFIALLDGMT